MPRPARASAALASPTSRTVPCRTSMAPAAGAAQAARARADGHQEADTIVPSLHPHWYSSTFPVGGTPPPPGRGASRVARTGMRPAQNLRHHTSPSIPPSRPFCSARRRSGLPPPYHPPDGPLPRPPPAGHLRPRRRGVPRRRAGPRRGGAGRRPRACGHGCRASPRTTPWPPARSTPRAWPGWHRASADESSPAPGRRSRTCSRTCRPCGAAYPRRRRDARPSCATPGMTRPTRGDAAGPDWNGAPLPTGYDARGRRARPGVTYRSLGIAAAAIRAGARFIATNADLRYPTPDGFMPGAGAIVAALRPPPGSEPLVIGKPEPAMFRAILEADRRRARRTPWSSATTPMPTCRPRGGRAFRSCWC